MCSINSLISTFILLRVVNLVACDDRCVSMLWHRIEGTFIGPVVNIRMDFVLLASSIIEITNSEGVSIQNDLEVVYKPNPKKVSKAKVIAYFRYPKRHVTLMPETSPYDVAILKTTPMPELYIWCPVANQFPIQGGTFSFFVSFNSEKNLGENITLSSKKVKPLVPSACYPFSDDMSAYFCTEYSHGGSIELGAPFFVKVRGEAVLYGLAAFKLSQCESELVYATNVVPAKRWILNVLKGAVPSTSPRRRTLNEVFAILPANKVPGLRFKQNLRSFSKSY